MFGYIKPRTAELKVKEHEFYKSVYCGLCKSMKKRAGMLRLTLSYDFVFLALIRMAMTGDSCSFHLERCVVHPMKKRPVLDNNQSLTFCADASALLTYYNVLDKIADGGTDRLKGYISYPFARRIFKKISPDKELISSAKEHLGSLSEYEKQKGDSADCAAEYFGLLLSDIFSHGLDERNVAIAREIGRHLGRWIYLIDALDDIEDDKKSGSYNPLLIGGYSCEQAAVAMNMELIGLERAIELITFSDSGIENIVKNIIYFGMPDCAERIIKKWRDQGDLK